MTTLREVIIYIVRRRPGLTDWQLTEAIFGSDERHQQVNTECRNCSEIERRQGSTHIGNYIRESVRPAAPTLTNWCCEMRAVCHRQSMIIGSSSAVLQMERNTRSKSWFIAGRVGFAAGLYSLTLTEPGRLPRRRGTSVSAIR